MVDEPVTLGQLEPGESFRLDGDKYVVVENQGTRYVLCQRNKEVVHLEQNYIVDPIEL